MERNNTAVGLTVESLNPHTLKAMRKPHTVLQAIEATKAMVDTGYTVGSKYMREYPSETSESVAEEVAGRDRLIVPSAYATFGADVDSIAVPYGMGSSDALVVDKHTVGAL